MSRAQTLAAVAVAATAAIPTLAYAGNVSSLSLANTPNFNCNAAGGLSSIDWGDFGSTGAIIVVATPTPEHAPVFDCGNGDPTTGFFTGDSFDIQFGMFGDGSVRNQKFMPSEVKLFTEEVVGTADKWKVMDTDFLLPAVQNIDAKITPGNFLGVELKWKDGEVGPGPVQFVFNADGELMLDPSIPPSGIDVSFYNTPRATPEPSALLLLGTGLAGVVASSRRRKKQ